MLLCIKAVNMYFFKILFFGISLYIQCWSCSWTVGIQDDWFLIILLNFKLFFVLCSKVPLYLYVYNMWHYRIIYVCYCACTYVYIVYQGKHNCIHICFGTMIDVSSSGSGSGNNTLGMLYVCTTTLFEVDK